METDPKPVITIFGDTDLIGPVLQKKLQARLKSHQLSSPPKEDAPCLAFSALCNGVKFVLLTSSQAQAKAGERGGGDSEGTLPLFQQPAVHTFWTECSDTDNYRTHYKPMITRWLSLVNQAGATGDEGRAESLIIYCITAEVRAKRQRTIVSSVTTSVEDRIRSDFKGKVDDVLQFRLASSDETRVLDSFTSLTARLNLSCITKFHRGIEKDAEAVARQRETRCEPEGIYDIFLQKLNLAVAYEMTLQNEEALQFYHEASADLEEALSMFGEEKDSVLWVERIRKAPCTSWDYPKLVWSNLAWRYLPAIQAGSSPLLHTHTFLLARLSHLLFELGRAWSVSELTINTLHCMARQIKQLKLSLPDGAFDCWAYMTCNEAIQAMMMRISADSLVSATSSLLLVRAELWQYALQKLHAIGVLCGLMPSCNVQNHDKVVISRITAGITLVSSDDVKAVAGLEDLGQKLKEILNNRTSFHTAYLTLGEMVIGAFKHAGRRRMAFRVGTMMAQFHRDLGLVNEAEDLLSDICKFYSEDQWMQLSTKAYSLLADCQMKLKMEDKHVTTMLLLASLPPYPAASHDPSKWFNSLRKISQKSPYQKMVNWEPLIELVAIHFKGEGGGRGGGGGYTCTVGERIQAELVVKYSGPEEMTPLIATMLVRNSTNGKRFVHLEHTTSSQSDVSLRKNSLSTLNSLGNLQDLDLESDTSNWPNSRPIGQHTKARSSSNMVTLIRGADLEAEGGGGGEFMLMAMRVKLQPGENRILVVGETKEPGDYFPHKVSLKWGSLDFERTISSSSSHHHRITVEPSRVALDISLTPELGVLIAGYPLNCTLTLKTGNDTSVPENATLRIVTDHTVECSTPDNSDSHHGNSQDGTSELTMKLPSLPQHSEHKVQLSLFIPSMKSTSSTGSLEDMTKSHDQTDQSQLYAWKHELQVYCDWFSPIHIARIPLMVYEPLTVSIKEHSAGISTFLQLVLKNTCPLPIALTDPMIATELELTHLHEEMPAVLCPYESYSCIWQVKPGNSVIGERSEGSFHLNCSPVVPGKETSEREFSFNFSLSDMQTIYELRASVEPQKSSTVVVRQPAILKYHIKNIAQNDSKQQLPNKLYYCVQVDTRQWTMLDSHEGVVRAPLTGQMVQLVINVSPNVTGLLPLPMLTLCKCPDDFNLASPSKLSEVELVPMTNAQVYNLSHGNVVSVAPPQSN